MINKDLLESAKQELFEQLCKNEVLLRIYSKDEIQKRIEDNIKAIYTNIVDYKRGGWCSLEKPVIAICDSEENTSPLTIQDIRDNRNKLETLIHEGVHAILKHRNGTGLHQLYANQEKAESGEAFSEIGRGINEGYTNWIVEKCGIETTTYELLTSINKQLEACIGEDAMMQFSKGNISAVYKALNMSEEQGLSFIRQLDDLYYLEGMFREIEKVENYIEEKICNLQEGQDFTQEELDEEEKERKAVEGTFTYKEIFTDDIKNALDAEESEDAKIATYTELLEKLRKNKNQENTAINSIVDSIETKIIQNLITDKIDSPKNIEEISKMMRLMQEIQSALSIYNGKCEQFDTLRERIEDISKKHLDEICIEIEDLIAKGEFTEDALKSEYKKICALFGKIDESDERRIRVSYASFLSGESKNPKENELLIRYFLAKNEPIPANISIQSTASKRAVVFEGKKLMSILSYEDNYFYESENGIVQKNETFKDKMDWTERSNTDYTKIISEFEELRTEILEQNPDAEIQISNKMIIVRNGEHYEFYDVIEGENAGIRRAEMTTPSPVDFMLNDNHRELIPANAKENIITILKRGLKKVRSIFSKEEKKEGKTNLENHVENTEQKRVANFSSSLRNSHKRDDSSKMEQTNTRNTINVDEEQER